MAIIVQALPSDGLHRFSDIDRSEEIRTIYRQAGVDLVPEPVHHSVPTFSIEGEHHSVQELVRVWQPVVDAGGDLLGAFDEQRLAGIALLGLEVAPGMWQLALLFVSRPFRRCGVAGLLLEEVVRLARERGARSLYVSATPSESAVGFYLSRGFRPTEPLPQLFAKEPEDVHMLLSFP